MCMMQITILKTPYLKWWVMKYEFKFFLILKFLTGRWTVVWWSVVGSQWSVGWLVGGQLVGGFKETHFEYVCVIWSRERVFTWTLSWNFLLRLHFQKMLTYDFIRRLKESRFGVGFKWDGSLFRIFGSKTLTPFRLYLGSVRLYLDSKHMLFSFWFAYLKIACLKTSVIKIGLNEHRKR